MPNPWSLVSAAGPRPARPSGAAPCLPKAREPHHHRSRALESAATASPDASPVRLHLGRHVPPRTGLSGPVVCEQSQVWGVQCRARALSCSPVPFPGSERAPLRQT